MGKRGSILLHVLVTGAVVALLAACLLRVAMLRYEVTTRAQIQGQERRNDDGALAYVLAAWGGTVCSAVPPGYTCSSTSGTCGCTCTQTSTGLQVATSVSGAACSVTITSNDLMKNLGP